MRSEEQTRLKSWNSGEVEWSEKHFSKINFSLFCLVSLHYRISPLFMTATLTFRIPTRLLVEISSLLFFLSWVFLLMIRQCVRRLKSLHEGAGWWKIERQLEWKKKQKRIFLSLLSQSSTCFRTRDSHYFLLCVLEIFTFLEKLFQLMRESDDRGENETPSHRSRPYLFQSKWENCSFFLFLNIISKLKRENELTTSEKLNVLKKCGKMEDYFSAQSSEIFSLVTPEKFVHQPTTNVDAF